MTLPILPSASNSSGTTIRRGLQRDLAGSQKAGKVHGHIVFRLDRGRAECSSNDLRRPAARHRIPSLRACGCRHDVDRCTANRAALESWRGDPGVAKGPGDSLHRETAGSESAP